MSQVKDAGNVSKEKKKTSGYVMALKYTNDLPRPPVDLKFVKIPNRPEKFFNYHMSTLEEHYKYRVHLEPMVGAPIHLIDPTTAEEPDVRLSAEDKHLLRRENDEVQEFYGRGSTGINASSSGPVALSSFGNVMSQRNLHESTKVRIGKHWLRKTIYMDNQQMAQTHNYATGLGENQKRLAKVEKEAKMLAANTQRLSKGERIEKSFAAAKQVPVHQTNKSLKPVKILSVLPSFALAQHPVYAVQFADDNILDDMLMDDSQRDEKGRVKRKRGRNLVDYTPAQIAILGKSILEQVNPQAEGQISLLIPSEKESNENDDKDSAFGDDSDEDNLSHKGLSVKWVRDYVHKTTSFKECERFGFVFSKQVVDAKPDENNLLYDSVQFVALQPTRLDMTRQQTDRWNTIETRKKRIKVDRRPLSIDEADSSKKLLTQIQEADLEQEEEEAEDGAPSSSSDNEKANPAPDSKTTKTAEVAKPKVFDSSDSEEEADL